MFLITNKQLKINQILKRSEINGRVLSKLSSKDLYLEKLIKSYTTSFKTSITGDIECDLLDDYDYSLELCDYIYLVEGDKGNFIVKEELNDMEYIKLAIDTILNSSTKTKLMSISNLLAHKLIKDESTFNYLSDKIISYIPNMTTEENYGFISLLEAIELKISDNFTNKTKCIEYLIEYFLEHHNSIGTICDAELAFIKDCLNKHYSKSYDTSIFDSIDTYELPF
ncbi:MAG: hypothetical protein IJ086_15830 [Clostridium sp.]|nr:hypothetical protein [Clostridium sp.]MBQ9000144.1 hypothetical protein [Clostridium sp.]